ncbi:PilZ domain-containing protein [Marispirochaeta sp.]|uniref:PilZ domain-containing protein n=1 Tax=Marispirochaeta sp. TaxID=2038653 RepID=UPI0029C90018|nr:PilZ domain-containing protein [Marispirochaeta sp.]
MEFLFESRFSSLMDGISGQFGTTPLGLLLFFLALIALPLFLTVLYLRQKRREKQTRIARSREIIRKKSSEIGLTPAGKELLDRLIKYDGGPESGYLLFFDEPRFHKAAAELQAKEPDISASSIAALRLKLGFTREPARRFHSTTQLPIEAVLLVRPRKQQGVYKAKITAVRTDGFEIVMEGNNLLTAGDSALFQYQNPQGTFLFRSFCIKRDGRQMLIRHQESFKQLQKRAYFRAVYTGSAEIGLFDNEDRYSSRFIDIGGGGASIINPEDRFSQGDFLELIFSLPGNDETFTLKGSVIRTSRGSRRLHVKFEGLKESQRDRIIGLVFKPQQVSG